MTTLGEKFGENKFIMMEEEPVPTGVKGCVELQISRKPKVLEGSAVQTSVSVK